MITSSISSRWPVRLASSTESSASMRSCIDLATGTAPVMFTIMIGNSEKLISLIEYWSAPAGKLPSAADIASRTSAIVLVLSQPNSNSSATPA